MSPGRLRPAPSASCWSKRIILLHRQRTCWPPPVSGYSPAGEVCVLFVSKMKWGGGRAWPKGPTAQWTCLLSRLRKARNMFFSFFHQPVTASRWWHFLLLCNPSREEALLSVCARRFAV